VLIVSLQQLLVRGLLSCLADHEQDKNYGLESSFQISTRYILITPLICQSLEWWQILV